MKRFVFALLLVAGLVIVQQIDHTVAAPPEGVTGFELFAQQPVPAVKPEAKVEPEELIPEVIGTDSVERGHLATFTLELGAGHNCVWEVFPFGTPKDVRRVAAKGGGRVSVLNFAASDPKATQFIVANYRFLGQDPDEESLVTYRIVTIRGPPKPPPDPDDPVDPPIPTGDNPWKTPGLHVIVIEESNDTHKLPLAQQNAIAGTAWRNYLDTATPKGVSGAPEYRLWDDDFSPEVVESQHGKDWRAAYEKAKKDSAGKTPYAVIGNGTRVFSGQFPATETEWVELLKKYSTAQGGK